MALYRFECKNCRREQEKRLPPTLKPSIPCETCGATTTLIPPVKAQAIVRAGDDWVGKGMELRAQMRRRSDTIDPASHHLKPALIPNVAGEEFSSWKEAARLAGSQGLDPKPFEQMEKHQ